eukprot:3486039-Pyramimonas_sp.AAC.1
MLNCISELFFNNFASRLKASEREHVLQAICECVRIAVDTIWWPLWKVLLGLRGWFRRSLAPLWDRRER